MARSVLDAKFEGVISRIADCLRPQGFVRQRKVLRAIADGNASIIDLQRSDRSSIQKIIFTINVGVVCGDLLDAERTTIKKAMIEDAHLRSRLGGLLEPAQDSWWEIDATTDDESLASELSQLLVRRAIPYLEQYKHTRALVALWESGQSPGLTAVQRSRYLSELKAAQDAQSPRA
jgi:hypothetical protein